MPVPSSSTMVTVAVVWPETSPVMTSPNVSGLSASESWRISMRSTSSRLRRSLQLSVAVRGGVVVDVRVGRERSAVPQVAAGRRSCHPSL
ncbi:hypothetical protein [Candidatus Amarobacter glycogenicus]|uniref:hypothetical protein n=1 Tax=Candidatus Amarobacter glycogenicus TaxID=3140699 RepID=UPI003137614B|nr:hypothetical protein [Dehalococcoidia bacterium]